MQYFETGPPARIDAVIYGGRHSYMQLYYWKHKQRCHPDFNVDVR